uniref:DOT1 domain-containing protein n=2 Tax=Amphora coffeiformis TaxID=265554 RepID=A0A7S3KVJ6_9STRA|eukprot:scaffold2962_cov169-Amphora_coffeaeformis.AAC.2
MHGKRARSSRRQVGRQSPDEEQVQEDAPRTPTKKVRLNVAKEEEEEEIAVVGNDVEAMTSRVVTPGTAVARSASSTSGNDTDASTLADDTDTAKATDAQASPARRSLFTPPTAEPPTQVTPGREGDDTGAKRRLLFGREVSPIHVQDNVRKVYKIVRRLTGSLGGNASSGPIYGELTMGSMQKMINLMKEHTGLCAESRFIDVGSGIGKPNLHVAQDPGVCFSYGLEVEESRWLLGMTCLKGMLEAAVSESVKELSDDERIHHQCFFEKGDIRQAKSFNPFSHVYMFSIGFPPMLWIELAKIWNRSSSPFLICYHSPKDIIDTYEFDVELVTQKQTSMHGSKEGHMGYIYKRKSARSFHRAACDPLFKPAFDKVEKSAEELNDEVGAEIDQMQGTGPATRSSRRRP